MKFKSTGDPPFVSCSTFYRRWIAAFLAGAAILATTFETASAAPAQGLDNPTMAYNLTGVRDYLPGMQFLDLMKMARFWTGEGADGVEDMKLGALRKGGYLDEDGWVKSLPEGIEKVLTIWQWTGQSTEVYDRRGTYVLEYEGEGTIRLGGDAKIISQEDGQIIFENEKSENLFLAIMKTDPQGTGNHLRNISIVAEEHYDLYKAGAVFNPDWLELIKDSRELRFMDWMQTNHSPVTGPDQMPSADGPFSDYGVAIEDMVKLANDVGADPWFTIPHMADEEYIREFATYVRDNLDPALTAKVEYSNETWNWGFTQTHWLAQQSEAEWGVMDHHSYYAKKAVENALIWNDVFGNEAEDRLSHVVASQTANHNSAAVILNAETWKEKEPENYIDPTTIFDELAITTYFGSSTVGKAPFRNELLAAIKDENVDAVAFLTEKLLDPEYRNSLPQSVEMWGHNAAIAASKGLKLTAYEGGQHVHHYFTDENLAPEDIGLINNFMVDFVRSPEMADLYGIMWDEWAKVSDGPFMQFGDIGAATKYGSWASRNSLTDNAPRTELIDELNATTDPWWDGAEGGAHYQQGIIKRGTAEADLLIGTSQEDYLLGGDGDDSFVAGAANDGINGGAGHDRALFDGALSDYVIRREDDGFRVTGPDGSDFLFAVEELMFDDNQVALLSDMIEKADGSLFLPGVSGPSEKNIAIDVTPTSGEVIDSSDGTGIKIDGTGVDITAINNNSALGQDLSDMNAEREQAYLISQSRTESSVEEGKVELSLQNALKEGAIAISPDKIWATNADDSFTGRRENDKVYGLDGKDRLSGAAGDDYLDGGAGDDVLHGGVGSDQLVGRNGNDIIKGGRDIDALYGGADDDWLHGGADDDLLYGDGGNDALRGGSGSDEMYGGGGQDILKGHRGDDALYGGAGDDRMAGHAGNDLFFGGAGNDRIYAGGGNDVMTGGEGADRFTVQSGQNRITDFTNEDMLRLREAVDATHFSATAEGLLISLDSDSVLLEGLDMDDAAWVMPNIVG